MAALPDVPGEVAVGLVGALGALGEIIRRLIIRLEKRDETWLPLITGLLGWAQERNRVDADRLAVDKAAAQRRQAERERIEASNEERLRKLLDHELDRNGGPPQ